MIYSDKLLDILDDVEYFGTKTPGDILQYLKNWHTVSCISSIFSKKLAFRPEYVWQMYPTFHAIYQGNSKLACHEMHDIVWFFEVENLHIHIALLMLVRRMAGLDMIDFPMKHLMRYFSSRVDFENVWGSVSLDVEHLVNLGVYKTAPKQEKREYLEFLIEATKKSIAIDYATRAMYHPQKTVFPDKLFPIIAAAEPVATNKQIPFTGNTVIAFPRDTKPLFYATRDIAEDGFIEHGMNTQGIYLPELRLIILRSGMHHTAVASIRSGFGNSTASCDIYSVTDAFPRMRAQKRHWEIPNTTPIKIQDQRFALLFELARVLSELDT